MIELQDWLNLDLCDEDRIVVESFFGLRPEWLPLGDLSKLLLARFEPEVDGIEPVEIELDECSIYWGRWHNHYDVGTPEGFERAVATVEDILEERRARVVKFFADGTWAGSTLCKPEDILAQTARPEAVGWSPDVLPADWKEPRSPTRLKVTSWKGTHSKEIDL